MINGYTNPSDHPDFNTMAKVVHIFATNYHQVRIDVNFRDKRPGEKETLNLTYDE